MTSPYIAIGCALIEILMSLLALCSWNNRGIT
jgi:hypothetical protein